MLLTAGKVYISFSVDKEPSLLRSVVHVSALVSRQCWGGILPLRTLLSETIKGDFLKFGGEKREISVYDILLEKDLHI